LEEQQKVMYILADTATCCLATYPIYLLVTRSAFLPKPSDDKQDLDFFFPVLLWQVKKMLKGLSLIL